METVEQWGQTLKRYVEGQEPMRKAFTYRLYPNKVSSKPVASSTKQGNGTPSFLVSKMRKTFRHHGIIRVTEDEER